MVWESILKGVFFILLIVTFLALAFKVYVVWRGKKMVGEQVKDLEEGIVYFFSERCGACKRMEKEIEELEKNWKVVRVDVFSPEGYEKAKALGVMATPTTLLVKRGRIIKVLVGVQKAEKIKDMMKTNNR